MREKMETDLLLVNMEELCRLLCVGRRTAEKIGRLAKAEIRLGRRRLWNVQKIKDFLDIEAM